jgi:hypothetical protein
VEYEAGLIKEESTSELLRFTIRHHLLNQVHNQPEYLILKQEQQQKAENYHQQQLHSQVILPSTTTITASHQRQVPNTPKRKNLVSQKKMIS